MCLIITIGISFYCQAQEFNKLGNFSILEGKWKGEATAYYSRDKNKNPRIELVVHEGQSHDFSNQLEK